MNDRERFLATMNYQPRDRAPICDFSFWRETITAWHDQGLPKWVEHSYGGKTSDEFFGMDRFSGGIGANVGLYPGFPSEVVEDRGDTEVVRNQHGVLLLRDKGPGGSIPIHLDHTLQDRASWEKHFKHRLDPDTPERYPDWDKARAIWTDPDFPYPRTVSGGSLYGWIRDWMGMENVSYLVYDDPGLFEEMVTTITDLIVEVHRRLFERGAKFDACSMWEDMCYNAGPLLGVAEFKKYLVPNYRRITDQLRAHGCNIIYLDCDGKIDDLLPHWLDAGVNCMFPLEVGTWNGEPVRYRKQYGKDLLLMGGFDKHILARTKQEIEAEVIRLTPLVEEGGYIGFCDHRVPPDVPLSNYMFYLEKVRHHWGRDHESLKPLGSLEP